MTTSPPIQPQGTPPALGETGKSAMQRRDPQRVPRSLRPFAKANPPTLANRMATPTFRRDW